MEGVPSSDFRKTAKRFVTVSIDGLVQAAAVATVVSVVSIVWAWRSHLHGAWIDRLIGAISAAFIIAFVCIITALAISCTAMRRNRNRALLTPRGFLDHKLNAERAMGQLPAVVERLTKITANVGRAINSHTEDLQRADSTAHQLKISKKVARSLNAFSDQMERVYVQLGTVGGSLSEGLEGWSKWVEQSGVNKTVPVTFSQALRELTVNMQTSNDITQSYIDSIKSSKWVSSILDNAINRHVGVVERILQKNVQMKASCLIAVNRIDPKAS